MTPMQAYTHAVTQHGALPMTYREFWSCMGQAMGRASSTARTHAIAAGWPYRNRDLGLVPVSRSKPAKPPRPKRSLCLTALRSVRKALAQLDRQDDPRTEYVRASLRACGHDLERLAAARVM